MNGKKTTARLNKQEFTLLKCQYKMKRENPSPKNSLPDAKRNTKIPSKPEFSLGAERERT